MARLAAAPVRRACFSRPAQAAKPCARLAHPSAPRCGPLRRIASTRPRYFSREGWLRARTRAVTWAIAACTISGSLVAAGWRDAARIRSIGFFAPAASIALDQSDRGGGAPSAGKIGPRRFIHLAPGLADRIDPTPRCLDLVAAHEQRRIAAYDVHQQSLIGLRRVDAECFGEAHVERYMLQAHPSGARLLKHQPELDAFIRLQPYG